MSTLIVAIPADHSGNKLFIKDYEAIDDSVFVKYRTTFNDIPFTRTELFVVDAKNNLGIVGDDGTILYRFAQQWLLKLIDDE